MLTSSVLFYVDVICAVAFIVVCLLGYVLDMFACILFLSSGYVLLCLTYLLRFVLLSSELNIFIEVCTVMLCAEQICLVWYR